MSFDARAWHVLVPLLPLGLACSQPIPAEDAGEGDETSETSETNTDTDTGTTTGEEGCETNADCGGYPMICVDDECIYDPNACLDGDCSEPFECYADYDCPEGFCDTFNVCVTVADVPSCGPDTAASFEPLPIPEPLDGLLVLDAAFADLDGDGSEDDALVVTQDPDTNTALVRSVIADAAVDTPVADNLNDPNPIRPFAALDLDGDDLADLAWDNTTHLGDGAGGFGAPVNFFAEPLSGQLHPGDFDGDGRDGLVWASANLWAFHNVDGALTEPQLVLSGGASVVGDFDGDGASEIAGVEDGAARIYEYFGPGWDEEGLPFDYAPLDQPVLLAGPVDGGAEDQLVGFEGRDNGNTFVVIWRNNLDLGKLPGHHNHGVLGDFDGDGASELVLIDVGGEMPSSEGTYLELGSDIDTACHTPVGLPELIEKMWAVDLDGDGRDELIVLASSQLSYWTLAE